MTSSSASFVAVDHHLTICVFHWCTGPRITKINRGVHINTLFKSVGRYWAIKISRIWFVLESPNLHRWLTWVPCNFIINITSPSPSRNPPLEALSSGLNSYLVLLSHRAFHFLSCEHGHCGIFLLHSPEWINPSGYRLYGRLRMLKTRLTTIEELTHPNYLRSWLVQRYSITSQRFGLQTGRNIENYYRLMAHQR